jgi:hypothetical protein
VLWRSRRCPHRDDDCGGIETHSGTGADTSYSHCADHITLARDRTNDRSLTRRTTPRLFLVPVAISIQAADIGFVYFNNAHELLELIVLQSCPQPMAHKPRRPIGTGTDHAMDLQGAYPLLTGHHQIENLEPYEESVVRIFKDRSDRDGEPIWRALGWPTLHALPMERLSLARVDLLVTATRADDAVRPAARYQVSLAGRFIGKQPVKFGQGHLPCDSGIVLVRHERSVVET